MVPLFLQLALILLCSVFAFIVMMRKHRKYWSNRGIPSPTPQLISGNFGSLYGDYPNMFQLRDWTRQYGKQYGVQYGWRNALVISDPAMVHELLVTKFEYFHSRHLSPIFGNLDTNKWISMFLARGGRWKRLRMIANPAFSVANLKKCMWLIDDSVKNAINFLEKARNKGEAFNIHRHFVEISFDVIARVALGQRESRQFDTEMAHLAIESTQKYNNTPFDYVGFAFPWFGIHFLEPFISWSGLLRKDPLIILRKQLMDELTARKKQRRESGEQQQQQQQQRAQVDFIDLFLETEQNEQQQQTEQCQNEGEAMLSKTALQRVEKRCTFEENAVQLLMFLLVGFDTSANTLSLVCHALALHAEVQAKVQEEIDSVCFDEDPTYEQLSQLKYTEAVVKETLRLLPIATKHFVEMSFDVIARVALGQRESRQFDTEMAQLAIESMQKYMNTPFDYVGFAFPWFGIHFLEPFINWSGMLRKDPLIILRKQLMDELMARKKLRESAVEQQQQQQRAQVDFIDLFLETE